MKEGKEKATEWLYQKAVGQFIHKRSKIALQQHGRRCPSKWFSDTRLISHILSRSRAWSSTRMRKPQEQGTVRHCASENWCFSFAYIRGQNRECSYGWCAGSRQESDFEAISGVCPYPNGSCNKDGFHIELLIYAIGMEWLNRPSSPPQNRTCEFPRIRLKWLWPGAFALGKRLAVAKLTASFSARAIRLLVWPPSFVTRDPSLHRQRSLSSLPVFFCFFPAWKQATF